MKIQHGIGNLTFFFLTCLFEREKKRNLLSIGSFPPRPPQSAMGWVEARSQELHPGLLGCLGALGKSWSVGFLNVSSRDFVPYKKGKITLKVDLFLGKQSCLWLGFIMYTLHYFCSSLCCTLFLWKWVTQREEDPFHLLVHSAGGCNDHIWARPKPGVSLKLPRVLGPSSASLPRCLSSDRFRIGTRGTWTSICRRCLYCRWLFYPIMPWCSSLCNTLYMIIDACGSKICVSWRQSRLTVVFFFVKKIFNIYIFERVAEKGRDRFSIYWFTHQSVTMIRTEVSSLEFYQGLPHGCQVPMYLDHLSLLSQARC